MPYNDDVTPTPLTTNDSSIHHSSESELPNVGGIHQYGENYRDTYAPVVNWASVRLIMTFVLLNKIHSRSIDFTLAFPQADTDVKIFMELPIGVDVPKGDRNIMFYTYYILCLV